MRNFCKRFLRHCTLFFCICAALLSPSSGHAQPQTDTDKGITLSVSNMTMADFFRKVEDSSSYTFFYNNDALSGAPTVTINITDADIRSLLDRALTGSGLAYDIRSGKILIKKSKSAAPASAPATGQQTPASDTGVHAALTGKVVDRDGKPLTGVAVMVKGSTTGVVTDAQGEFSLKARPDDVLSAMMVGYKSTDTKVSSKTHIDITLEEALIGIDEVVVTALGIKRDEKSLGYAATKIDGKEMNTALSNNWLNSLSGKVAGLNFDKGSTGPLGSVRVTLRGESSFDMGNNEALFVVDGVPINNTMTATGGSASNTGTGDMPVDFGNGAADINPENIENVTVLKGPAATALYGSRAANGAIIITTKSGTDTPNSIGVSLSSTLAVDVITRYPDLQYEYGSGAAGKNSYYAFSTTPQGSPSTHSSLAWGPRFDGQMYYQYYNPDKGINVDPSGNWIPTPWQSNGNWFKDFFRPGITATNTLTVEGRPAKDMSMRVTFTDSRNKYIMPNTGFVRQSFAVKMRSKLNRYITSEASVNYYRRDCDNIPAVGYGPSSVMYALIGYSPNLRMDWAKDYWMKGMEDREQNNLLNTNGDNPYFSLHEQTNTQDKDRIYGNVNVTVSLTRNLDLMLRTGIDFSNDFRTMTSPWSSKKSVNGSYSEQTVRSLEMNNDFMFRYSGKLYDGLDITASFGGNSMVQNYSSDMATAERLKRYGEYTLANSVDRVKYVPYRYKKSINSFYGLVQLAWKNYAFLDITGRNDWSSTLPSRNNSYFYPSVSTSFILTEMFDMDKSKKIIDFAKLRLSWAKVGNDTRPYRTMNYLSTSDFAGSYNYPTVLADPNLKPEIVTSYEVGIDVRMFKNRFTLDAAYYHNDCRNQIIDMPVSAASGSYYVATNAGKIRNRGIELAASGTLIKNKNLQWRVNGTWTKNYSKVIELSLGSNSWVISSSTSRAYVEARIGGTVSAMYGRGYERAPQGSVIVHPDGRMENVGGSIVYDSQGYPKLTQENIYLGDCAPKWRGGFGTSLKYKSLTMGVSLDGQYGGKVYSITNSKLGEGGKLSSTLAGRYDGLVGDGVLRLPDGTYKRNDIRTPEIAEYYKRVYNVDNVEGNFISTQFLKLREVSIEYALPSHLLEKLKVVKRLSVAVYGRDLFCWSKFPGWDPEVATLNNGEITPGFETAQLPSTTTFGASLKISF